MPDGRDVRLDRLRAAWHAEPSAAELAAELAAAEARAGRRRTAADVLAQARRAGAAAELIGAAVDRLALGRWSTALGGWPARTWPGCAPRRTPRVVWTHEAPRADVRYGRPPCVCGHHLGLVAQSTVVGGRFEELVGIDLRDGSHAWQLEYRNVVLSTPLFALECDGRAPAMGWAHVVELDEGADGLALRIDVLDAATGTRIERHEVVWARAFGVSSERGPWVMADGSVCWDVRVVTEDEASYHALVLDGRDGRARAATRAEGETSQAAGSWRDGLGRGYDTLHMGGRRRLVGYTDDTDTSTWWGIPESCAPGFEQEGAPVAGCCMGEDLVLATSSSDGTRLWACQPTRRHPLWQLELSRGPFHVVPVPIAGGILAVAGGAVVALRG